MGGSAQALSQGFKPTVAVHISDDLHEPTEGHGY